MDDKSYHMTPDDFRTHGHEVIEWLATYMEQVDTYPVLCQAEPGSIRARLPEHPPPHGESFSDILGDLNEVVLPGLTHWQSPNFFAYFPANVSGPSILAELLSAGLGVQGMLWSTSPACTEVETHMLDWVRELLGLPEQFSSTSLGGGVIQDSASSAALCALLAARERATEGDANRAGVPHNLVAYCSTQAHSSIVKSVRIAGLGSERLRQIQVDDGYAMRADLLERQMEEDRRAGLVPCFVVATVGTTSSGAEDPVRAIGEVCARYGAWLHVDAAMAGTAAVCPEFRAMHDGVELADSFCFNPHKWMFVNFDCNCFFVSDKHALIRALGILPEYLKNPATASGRVIDYRDWQVPLGRRFRALKLWFVMRHYGVEGLRHHIRQHVAMAQTFAGWVDDHPDFERCAETPLNLICFRHVAGDETNQRILKRLNDSGRLYLTHTRLAGVLTLRMAIGATNTRPVHVETAWEQIQEVAQHIVAESCGGSQSG